MEFYVGTSGWSNPIWNPNGLEWYAGQSGLNAIELSMPFYHLPTPEQVSLWAKQGQGLKWTVKVNRAVSHFFRFNDIALEQFHNFRTLFSPLDDQIAFYLFQLPPNSHPSSRDQIETFFKASGIGPRFALEWRNQKWFTKENIEWAKSLGITVVSADSPFVPRMTICTSDTVYLRLHGRTEWLEHQYSRKELMRIAQGVQESGCKKVLAFLNNDSAQLRDARALINILSETFAG